MSLSGSRSWTEPPETSSSASYGLPAENRLRRTEIRRELWIYVFLFVGSFLLFFLSSDRAVNVYDEGIQLTGVMRVMAGQVPHRDFYYNYGPANLYPLAWLFRIFGPSVLLERLVALLACSALATSLYAVARQMCGRLWALCAAVLSMLWMIGIAIIQSIGIPAVCLLTLWSTWLLVPIFGRPLTKRRLLVIGMLTGILWTFRYDMGIGVLGTQILVIAIAVWLRVDRWRSRLHSAWTASWLCLLGFATIVLPVAIAYLSVAPLHDVLYDIVLYSSKYYRAARRLPFPPIQRHRLEETGVYLLILIIVLGFYGAGTWLAAARRKSSKSAVPEWVGFLLAFSMIATLMYLKGLIRISVGQLYGSIFPSVLLGAVLWQRRKRFGVGFRIFAAVIFVLFFAAAAVSARRQLLDEYGGGSSMAAWLLRSERGSQPPLLSDWCNRKGVLTKGLCFTLDDDHIRTVEYLQAHSQPGDALYVGLPHHDRIFVNDNITYFATQRLPATKWSHFDPYLQNRRDIQEEMVGELERNKPQYVTLDSEFEGVYEPNGSSVSTGVHLLDDYIAAHYTVVKTFGVMTVLKRDEAPVK